MNKLYKIACLMLTGVALLATTSCSDPDDEITTANFDRLLRPAELQLKIYDKTNIKATMDFVTVPDYVDVLIEVNDDPLAENKNFKTYKTLTINAKELTTSANHVTLTYNIQNLTYFKDYRVTFTSRDASGKKSLGSTSVATTEGIFKTGNDSNRDKDMLEMKWLEVNTSKLNIKKIVNGKEEDVETITLDETAKSSHKYKKNGLDPNTEYAFYIYDDNSCLGRTTWKTFPDYTEIKAGDDVYDAITNLAEGKALLLSPADDGTKIFTTSKDVILDKKLHMFARDTENIEVQKLAFVLKGCSGLTLENIKCTHTSEKTFIKFTEASGDYTLNNVEVTGKYNQLFVNPSDCLEGTVSSVTIKNCFIHDMGKSGKDFFDFAQKSDNSRKSIVISNMNIEQTTFANIICRDFARFDYYTQQNTSTLPKSIVKNCSFYKVEAPNKGLFYIRSANTDSKNFDCTISKCVFESVTNSSGVFYSKAAESNGFSFSGNYYKDSDDLQRQATEGTTPYDKDEKAYSGKSAFKDPANFDFTIQNEGVKNAEAGNTEFVKK